MNITKRVRAILNASRKARNSDKELDIIYMQKSGVNLSQYQIDKLRAMPAFETIRRVRQKIQEQGEFKADRKIEDARFEKYRQVKGEIGISEPEAVENYLERNNLMIVED